jgi:exosortase E/protease (VPEID-CTERM system)
MVTAASRTFVPFVRLTLAGRAALLGLTLFAEKFALNFLVDFSAAQSATGLGAWVRIVQHAGFRFLVAFGLSLALFAFAARDPRWREIDAAASGRRVALRWLVVHAVAVLALVPLSYYLYGRGDAPLAIGPLVALWLVCALVAVLSLATALAPWSLWRSAARTLGLLWLYAALAAAVAASALQWSERLWAPTAAETFRLVHQVLRPFIPSLTVDPGTLVLRSQRFAVQVSDECSGLEGAGLVLAFCGAWLLCFRREYRFPRALLLLPAGLALSFALNVLRIAVLMLIGNAGYPQMAIYGFHSQAGWIAFNAVAGLLAMASRRSAWLHREGRPAAGAVTAPGVGGAPGAGGAPVALRSGNVEARFTVAENPTARYLMPFLCILAAGMLSRSLSSGFETLYGLRLLAAAAALVWAWPRLGRLDWRFGWRGLGAGVAIFLIWIAAARLLTRPEAMPPALLALSAPARLAWIAIRVAAAVITVPLAEELAFRGYLLRRLISSDFESVRFRDVGATALLVSAAVFGAEHGALWLPGVVAGLVYGAVAMRTGRLGEAVTAHATTNALLAAYVLVAGQWQLW